MISREEQQYLYWLTSSRWTGAGVVVEMGPWLGGSTLCLAAGIEASEHRHRFATPLHTFDNFIWREFMAGPGRPDLGVGESFEGEFRANLRAYEGTLSIHVASLPDDAQPGDPAAQGTRDLDRSAGAPLRWDPAVPVEILFIDGAKSWEGMRHLLGELAPHFIPGRTLLVCQDYKYWGAYWVPLILELLGDRVQPLHVLKRNTVTFRVGRPIPAETVRGLGTFHQLTVDAGIERLRAAEARMLDRGDHVGGAILRAGTARFLQHKGSPDAAREALREAEALWPLSDAGEQLERARAWLADATGAALPPSARTRFRRGLHVLRRVLPAR